mmetsp:Transcript_29063/g.52226  ORF Transcript_29063/g.52226 Transcript_29063/m.52226 type:complete len:259 (-) Transcript_29063:183-959(-)
MPRLQKPAKDRVAGALGGHPRHFMPAGYSECNQRIEFWHIGLWTPIRFPVNKMPPVLWLPILGQVVDHPDLTGALMHAAILHLDVGIGPVIMRFNVVGLHILGCRHRPQRLRQEQRQDPEEVRQTPRSLGRPKLMRDVVVLVVSGCLSRRPLLRRDRLQQLQHPVRDMRGKKITDLHNAIALLDQPAQAVLGHPPLHAGVVVHPLLARQLGVRIGLLWKLPLLDCLDSDPGPRASALSRSLGRFETPFLAALDLLRPL